MSSSDREPAAPTETDRRSILPPVIGGLMGAIAVTTSVLSERAFAVFVSILVVGAATDLALVLNRKGFGVSRVLLVSGALALTLASYWGGENRIGLVTALAVIGTASWKVLGGLRPESLKAIATTIFGSVLLGLLGGFAILLRHSHDGRRLVLAFATMIAGYHIGSWVGTRRLAGAPVMPSLSATPTWWGIVFGLAGSVLGSFVSLTFMEPPFMGSAALALGAIVALAAIVGSLGGRMIRADIGVSERSASVPGLGGLYARLDTLLVTVPAFYYGFRLYLT
jgi:CDP-diglyceride synthetase